MDIYQSIKPTYLYVKQHSITKLKYFGKTTRDPYKYNGSGKYWKNHIKKHGTQYVDTLWVSDIYCNTSISIDALSFSLHHDIVNSPSWANMKLENGLDGGKSPGILMSEESKRKMRKPKSESHKQNMRKPKSKQTIRKPRSESHKQNISKALTGRTLSTACIDKLSKQFIIITPDGDSFIIKNLKKFCRENGLNSGNMFLVAKGGASHHKGYKCQRLLR